MKDLTTIQLEKTTRNRLRRSGFKGETYDDVINKILDKLEIEK